MAFDSGGGAEEVYQAGLEHIGIPRRETAGMNAAQLRVLLKNVRTSQASHGAPAMAYDGSAGSSALDGILKGIKPPRDGSHRNDFRR
jgi:hypothetical protein